LYPTANVNGLDIRGKVLGSRAKGLGFRVYALVSKGLGFRV